MMYQAAARIEVGDLVVTRGGLLYPAGQKEKKMEDKIPDEEMLICSKAEGCKRECEHKEKHKMLNSCTVVCCDTPTSTCIPYQVVKYHFNKKITLAAIEEVQQDKDCQEFWVEFGKAQWYFKYASPDSPLPWPEVQQAIQKNPVWGKFLLDHGFITKQTDADKRKLLKEYINIPLSEVGVSQEADTRRNKIRRMYDIMIETQP